LNIPINTVLEAATNPQKKKTEINVYSDCLEYVLLIEFVIFLKVKINVSL